MPTERELAKLPGPGVGQAQRVHSLGEGLLLVIGRKGRSYSYQRDMLRGAKKVSVRKKLKAASYKEAKDEAAVLRASMKAGFDPTPRKVDESLPPETLTLGKAWAEYRKEMELNGAKRASLSMHDYLRRFVPEGPMAEIKLAGILKVREAIAKGEHPKLVRVEGSRDLANKVLERIRHVWGHAVLHLNAPPCPLPSDRMSQKKLRLRHEPKRRILQEGDIATFWAETGKLTKTHRNFWRILLLSGARKGSMAQVKRGDYDRVARRLRFAKDKTGAYEIPLSTQMVAILEDQLEINTSPYIFPRSRTWAKGSPPGPIKEAGRLVAGVNPHALRRTYETVLCAALQVSDVHRKVLTNHAFGKVDNSYLNRTAIARSPELAAVQQALSNRCVALAGQELVETP